MLLKEKIRLQKSVLYITSSSKQTRKVIMNTY